MASPIAVEFDHPLREGMEAYLEVREGSTAGRVLGGSWESSNGRTRFTFRGSEQLQHRMAHEIHVGGGLVDHRGHHVDFEEHGFAFGGEWCTDAMVGAGMMGHHQVPGWMHPDGHYGMRFRFWTAP